MECFHCKQPLGEGPDTKGMTDNGGQWRALCIDCPNLCVQLIFYKNDMSKPCRLCISPFPARSPGLWLMNAHGEPIHHVTIEKVEQEGQNLIFTAHNQELVHDGRYMGWEKVVWTMLVEHGNRWHNFRKTWLTSDVF
jgi:hypothetical protein